MTENEKNIGILTKDVAVVVSIQKGCQEAQAKTTKNVDKLVVAVNTLSHDTVYLQGLSTRISGLEDSVKWLTRTGVSTLLGVVGAIVWFLFDGLTK